MADKITASIQAHFSKLTDGIALLNPIGWISKLNTV